MIESGDFGDVTHVEVFICLDILGEGSAFADPNVPHPCLSMKGGAIADFLTHLACLSHAFVGPHSKVSHDLVEAVARPPAVGRDAGPGRGRAGDGDARLQRPGSQPDAFWLRVYGTKMQATADLFETRCRSAASGVGPKPLRPLFNSLDEAKAVRRSAYGTLARKLDGGPGSYEGLWALLAGTYKALGSGRGAADHARADRRRQPPGRRPHRGGYQL